MKRFLSVLLAITCALGIFTPLQKEVASAQQQDEIMDTVYNEDGELVSFSVLIDPEKSPEIYEYLKKVVIEENISLRNGKIADNGYIMLNSPASMQGLYKFISGACVVLEVFTGYSCIDVARYIGLQLINGLYMMGNRPYSGEWKVTYGYIPGCEQRHSLTCFRAVYTKVG